MPVTTFSVTYEIPVSPERLAQLEDEIARVADSPDAESRLARLANQMLPEKRTEATRQVANDDGIIEWFCPKPECNTLVVRASGGTISAALTCPYCLSSVNRVDHPMSLDLYRMRTRRTDGVEIQVKPQA